ncbi:TSUP family transporter [Luteolibacter ambystomatis]|uniref:Probable membrane transporter protein n=1 Tax=Luteolibacter ambystomatis TaxID=2824561 RepID=A0A975G6X2_9BACT|nr:TSUP family transporter [Luteolibacter ambystomatis]QUE49927.1 TSUP family transporter [Luteolibacter ambystomatis]
MPPWTYLLLFFAGLAGGFIDAIAGGGGLITVPALLAAGLPPGIALGTNKFQSSFGTSMAVSRFLKAGLLKMEGMRIAVVLAFAASMAGAFAVSVLDKDLLKRVIPWMLAAVAVYTAVNRRFGLQRGERKMAPMVFATVFGLALGFYDGFFGPGTGSFWTVALVTLLGSDLREATGYTKAANLASNAGALVVFLAGGSVHFAVGAVMIAGQLLGARAGASLAIRRGAGVIRPVFLTVVFAMTVKLLWDAWGR